jgi:hypothetical protein
MWQAWRLRKPQSNQTDKAATAMVCHDKSNNPNIFSFCAFSVKIPFLVYCCGAIVRAKYQRNLGKAAERVQLIPQSQLNGPPLIVGIPSYSGSAQTTPLLIRLAPYVPQARFCCESAGFDLSDVKGFVFVTVFLLAK